MSESYLYQPTSSARTEHIDRKSRFIAIAERIETAAEAKNYIQILRKQKPDASHVVYAFRVGGLSRDEYGMNDDGEPKGTAGRPVLEVLRGSSVTNVVIAVVRYFGGTKLGTGGLVRAYTSAAQGVLETLRIEVLEERAQLSLACPYELHAPIRRVCEDYASEGLRIVSERFATEVRMVISLKSELLPHVSTALRDVSRGTIEIDVSKETPE